MLKLWTRNKDGTGQGWNWGEVVGAPVKSDEQGKAMIRILAVKYPRAEFLVAESKPED